MLVRDEDVTQRRQRYTGKRELSRHAVTAIDDVSHVVADDHLRRARARLPGPRTSSGSKENELRARALRGAQPRA